MLTKGYDNCIHNALYHQVNTNEEKTGNDKLHQLFIPKTISPVSNTAKCTVTMKLDYLLLERAMKKLNNCESCVERQSSRYAALLRPPMEIKRLFFHFKTSYNKTDASVFNLTDI